MEKNHICIKKKEGEGISQIRTGSAGTPWPLAAQLPAVPSQKPRQLWPARVRSGQLGRKAARGNLRVGLMKPSLVSGCVLLPVFSRVLTPSVPYLRSTVSTGLSVYRNKTTISNFASAGGKTATAACAFLSLRGPKWKSISRVPYLFDLSTPLASLLLSFVFCQLPL